MTQPTRKQKGRIHRARMVITILLNYFEYFGQNSAFPSQQKILKELKRMFSYDIKIRQLNYILADLERCGIIRRYKRHKIDPEKGFIFKSSRYYIDQIGWRLAAVIKIISWKRAKKMINIILKGGQNKVNGIKEWFTPDWMIQLEAGIKENITSSNKKRSPCAVF